MSAAGDRLVDLAGVLGLDPAGRWADLPPPGSASGAGEGDRLVRVTRRASPFRTSFVLEEVDVELADGRRLGLLLKHLEPGSLHERSEGIKPDFLLDPAREVEVYRRILAPRGLGPALYGTRADPAGGRFRLLIERVRGRELYQAGEIEAWEAAARWLARFHLGLLGEGERLAEEARLVLYDREFYTRWMDRARAFAIAHGTRRHGTELDGLARGYGRVVDRLLALPRTVVHGEFYASNVIVRHGAGGVVEVVPVDWETAGFGPGPIDLAGLVAGAWTEAEKRRLALAYRAEWIDRGGEGWHDEEDFLEAVDCCRLHCAVQWLGWAPNWAPPAEHRQDWSAEALRLGARLCVAERVPGGPEA